MKRICFFLLAVVMFFTACSQPKALVYQDIENFKLQQVSNTNTTISLDIRLYNPNRYELKLKDADIDVYLNNAPLGKMQVAGKYDVPGRDTCVVPVTLNVDLKNVLPNMLQLVLNSGNADVKLTGTIKAGRHGLYVSIPIAYEGKQDLSQLLKF